MDAKAKAKKWMDEKYPEDILKTGTQMFYSRDAVIAMLEAYAKTESVDVLKEFLDWHKQR